MSAVSERAFRRNVAMLMADTVGFTVGMALLGPTTILPSLVQQLGGGPVVVGMVGAIQVGGFFLPQLVAGRYVANRALVKRYVVLPATLSRACLLFLPVALLLLATRAPTVALAAVLLTFAAFNVVDALSVVGWFDLMAKAVPLERRGRVMGVSHSLAALLAVGGGMLVTDILARPNPFPLGYVLVLFLAVGFLAICPPALALIRESPALVEVEARPSWREYLPGLGAILRRDRRFAWLAAVMWLGGLGDMAGPFYVLYAGRQPGVPPQAVGLFISAGVVGGFVSGALLGSLGDRKGSSAVIKVLMAARCLSPALALAAPHIVGRLPWLGTGAFLLVFAFTGMVGVAYMVGYMNYLLEIAPPSARPMYVALANTLNGLLVVAPLIAGWVVASASYELLFLVALVPALAGLAVALRCPAAPVLRRGGSAHAAPVAAQQ